MGDLTFTWNSVAQVVTMELLMVLTLTVGSLWGISYIFKAIFGMNPFRFVSGKIYGFPAWHFLPVDKKLRYGDEREVKVGETLGIPNRIPPKLCRYGMHASVKLFDALQYAPGPILCRVLVTGKTTVGRDKIAGLSRTCTEMYTDLSPVFLRWVCLMVAQDLNGSTDTSLIKGLKAVSQLIDETRPRQKKDLWTRANHFINNYIYFFCTSRRLLSLALECCRVTKDACDWASLLQDAHELATWRQRRMLIRMLKAAGVKNL